ncbi:MAG: hypothetical protein IPN76_30170 [Saprospiraceae bacterium]|nr:hypothetical protein [Saprospiraceae bacterium]
MLDATRHRGPDDQGFYINEDAAVGMNRLSIIDLSDAGHQPMFSSDNRYVIVYNGEVYNYHDLRKDLKARGIVFKSHTDTEVVLQSYLVYGLDMLQK